MLYTKNSLKACQLRHYVQILPHQFVSFSALVRRTAIVQFTYDAQYHNDVSLKTGDEVTIIGETNDGWLEIELKNGKTGTFPRTHIFSPVSLIYQSY